MRRYVATASSRPAGVSSAAEVAGAASSGPRGTPKAWHSRSKAARPPFSQTKTAKSENSERASDARQRRTSSGRPYETMITHSLAHRERGAEPVIEVVGLPVV